MAVPIARPRRSCGVACESQARPALQEMLELRPWPARASMSVQKPPARPKASVEAASSQTPKTVIR